MARKKQQDWQIERSLELGRKNAALMPKVRRWCGNLNIEMTSAGLLAQMYNLPVGLLRVTCPHGNSFTESMHLDSVARSFILRNCAACPYHQEVSPDNFGRQVFEEQAKAEAGRQQAQERHEELKRQLQQHAQQSLATVDTPRQSINALILALQDAEPSSPQYQDIADQLTQAAQIAPEHFSDEALHVLVNSLDERHRTTGLSVALQICVHRKNVPNFVFEAATQALTQLYDIGGEAACGVLIERALHHKLSDVLPLLERILAVANYRLADFMMSPFIRDKPQFPNALKLLQIIFAQAPAAARQAFDARLRLDHKETKLNAAKTLQAMLPDTVEEILPLTGVLLYSLELEDDQDDMSADHEVCELLSHLYVYAPEFVGKKIDSFWPFASDEVKGVLAKIYALIIRHASSEDRWSRPLFPKDRYVEQAPVAMEKLYNATADIRLDVEVRHYISEKFEHAVKEFPQAMFNKLDRLLGRLAMIIREAEQVKTEKREAWEHLQNDTHFSGSIRNIVKIIRTLIRHNPPSAFTLITRLLHELGSKDQERLKVELVGTLNEFGREDGLLTQLIPELYHHLVDYESNWVRSQAIDVMGDLLDYVPEAVPSNMIELVVIYLRDPYVIIHKGAVRALAHTKLKRDAVGWDALTCIINLEHHYAQQQDQTRFLEDIVRTLASTFRDWPEIKQYIVTKLLPKYSRHQDKHFAEDMLVRLARSLKDYPKIAPEFVESAFEFLHNTRGNRHGRDDQYTDRFKIWHTLFNMPRELLGAHVHTMRQIALRNIEHDPLETYRVIELMSHAGLHEDAVATSDELLATVPDVKANAYKRDSCKLISAAEQAELLCVTGEFEKAIQILEKANSGVPEDKELHKKWEEMWRDDLTETL